MPILVSKNASLSFVIRIAFYVGDKNVITVLMELERGSNFWVIQGSLSLKAKFWALRQSFEPQASLLILLNILYLGKTFLYSLASPSLLTAFAKSMAFLKGSISPFLEISSIEKKNLIRKKIFMVEPRFEPRAAEWEAQMPPLCYAAPLLARLWAKARFN